MIVERFKAQLIDLAKTHQDEKLGVLRFFLAQLKNKEIELRPQGLELTDEHALKALKKLIKQNVEASAMYQSAGRTEAFDKVQREKVILEEFMNLFPAELVEKLNQPHPQISFRDKNGTQN